MPPRSSMQNHRELVKSLENALEKAEMLELDDLSESIGEDLAEAESL